MEARIVQQAIRAISRRLDSFMRCMLTGYSDIWFLEWVQWTTAEDLMCEVFLKAGQRFRNSGSGSSGWNFKSWLYRIAHNA